MHSSPIENLKGRVSAYARSVSHWCDGTMLVRWLGAPVLGAEQGFRRLPGHCEMPHLVAALDRTLKTDTLDPQRKAA